jgi:hypothetical protein
MAKAPKTVKKVTKRVAKVAALPDTLWVISERKLLTWTPIEAFANEGAARHKANVLDSQAGVAFNKFKVDQVVTKE